MDLDHKSCDVNIAELALHRVDLDLPVVVLLAQTVNHIEGEAGEDTDGANVSKDHFGCRSRDVEDRSRVHLGHTIDREVVIGGHRITCQVHRHDNDSVEDCDR